ncbi:MAG: DegV family protein [Streptococcaceae bacterium]|jgi:DegV family protein with EDD domain|nr:DegV family protein [Streptococcaceae bacterium]
MTFQIFTEITADLPTDLIDQYNLEVFGMDISLDGENFHTIGPDAIDATNLIKAISSGKKVQTSAVPTGIIQEAFKKYVELGMEILYLSFSSGLSGTFQSANIARDLVLEEFPNAKITILDSLAAASGEGYLVEEVMKMRDAGKTVEEVVEALNEIIPRLKSWFMVDDLNFLALGGRISKTAAVFGSMVNIKPVLDVDPTGHLRAVAKMRGSKKAIATLIQNTIEDFDLAFPKIIVAYSGDSRVAEEAKLAFEAALPAVTVVTRPLGAVISAHTGSGTLAIFSVGREKRK